MSMPPDGAFRALIKHWRVLSARFRDSPPALRAFGSQLEECADQALMAMRSGSVPGLSRTWRSMRERLLARKRQTEIVVARETALWMAIRELEQALVSGARRH